MELKYRNISISENNDIIRIELVVKGKLNKSYHANAHILIKKAKEALHKEKQKQYPFKID